MSGVKKEIIGQVEETPQYTTFKDKYMGQLLNETATDAAKQMEKLLVDCTNSTTKGKKYGRPEKTKTRDPVEIGEEILKVVPKPLTLRL